MGLFNKSEEQKTHENEVKKFKKKVEDFQHKCNFLYEDGHCFLGSSYPYDCRCAFEDCIFMKLLKVHK